MSPLRIPLSVPSAPDVRVGDATDGLAASRTGSVDPSVEGSACLRSTLLARGPESLQKEQFFFCLNTAGMNKMY
jgi:hypothetical protein